MSRDQITQTIGGRVLASITYSKTTLIKHTAFTLTSSITDHYSLFGSFLISSVSKSEENSYSKIHFGKLLRYGSGEEDKGMYYAFKCHG